MRSMKDEGSTQGRPSESRTADPPFFAPVSSGTQMMLLLILIWCGISKQRCWKAGFLPSRYKGLEEGDGGVACG